MPEFPRLWAQLPAHLLLPHLGRGGLNPSSSSSLPAPGSCSTRHPPGNVLWMLIFHLPLEMDSGSREVLQERLRNEGSGNGTTAGILPASTTPRSCALGEKGQGAWIGGFKSGEEVEQVLGECGRTWEIKPENWCREPEILWLARDHATSQEWNHGLSNSFVPPVESCGEQMWKGWVQPGVSTLRSTGREPS